MICHIANLACMACSLTLEISLRINCRSRHVDSISYGNYYKGGFILIVHVCILCTYPSDPILTSGALKGIIEV